MIYSLSYDISGVCCFHRYMLLAVLNHCKVGTTWEKLSLLQDAWGLSSKSGMWCQRSAWHRNRSSPWELSLVLRLLIHDVLGCTATWRLLYCVFINQQNAGSEWNHLNSSIYITALSRLLGMVRNARVSSGSASDPQMIYCNKSYHTKNRTVAIGRVLPPKTQHFNITSLPPIKYLSFDRIMTRSLRTLWSFLRWFTFRFQIGDKTNIQWVAIENRQISVTIRPCFTATPWIWRRSEFWKREVKECLELHNLHTDHIVIWSELKHLIWQIVAGTAKCNPGAGTTRINYRVFLSGRSNNSAKTERVGFHASW